MITLKTMIEEKGLSGVVEEAFVAAYCRTQGDPHSVFANILGVTRDEAKRMCYEYSYTAHDETTHTHIHFMLNSLREDLKTMLRGYRRYTSKNGLKPLTAEEAYAMGEKDNV